MSRKIIGVTVGSPLPKSNLNQTDPRKGDYVKGREIIPTKVSDLDNDAGYLTQHQDLSEYATKKEIPTVPKNVSAFENDSGYLTEHQDISGKLDANKLPEAINDALAQAKASGEFDGKDGKDGKDGQPGNDGISATHSWNGTVLTVTSASGTSSADLKGSKGDPGKSAYEYARDGGYTGTEAVFATKLAKECPTKVSELTNDKGFITSSDIPIKSVNGVIPDENGNIDINRSEYATSILYFGAKGDGVTDDTKAINDAIVSGAPLEFPVGVYLISETLNIGSDAQINCFGEIKYTGTDYAVSLDNSVMSNVYFKQITAPNGNGLKLHSHDSKMCAYNNVTVGNIEAKGTGILMLSEYGCQYNEIRFAAISADVCIDIQCSATAWNTETKWYGGHMGNFNNHSTYAIKAVNEHGGNVTTHRFYNVGFEGVKNGCILDNVRYFVFNYPRTSEAIDEKCFILKNKVRGCRFDLSYFPLKWLSYTEHTEGSGNIFNGVFMTDGGSVYKFSYFEIWAGMMHNCNQTELIYKNIGTNETLLTLDTSSYMDGFPQELFVANDCTIDSRYYHSGNINTIYAYMSGDTESTVVIKDTGGNVIVRVADHPWEKIKLTAVAHSLGSLAPNGWVVQTIETIPAWALANTKPTYNKSEVGLGNVDNVKQYSVSNPPPYPVTSVNGKTGAVNLDASTIGARSNTWMPSASDVGALPDTYVPPNQTASQVGADPVGTAASAVGTHNTKTDAHNDIRLLISALTTRLDALANSDDETLDQMAEVVAYIKDNRDLIEQITTGKVSITDIVDNLTTNVSNKPLSASQGVALKALIDAIAIPTKLSQLTSDSTHRVVTDTEKETWNAKSNFSGNYADLSGTPTIPTVPTKVSAFTNDKGYLTEHQDISGKLDASALPTAINTALAQAKASGEFDGQDGSDGEDGVPATHSWNGTTLTITSASGTSSANLKGDKGDKGDSIKGDTGSPGADGVSPTVAVSKSGKVTTVSITDKNGTKTATINDGADGASGSNGKDGKTPVKGTDYWTAADKSAMVADTKAAMPTITVTGVDASGTTHTWTMYGVKN